VAHKAQLLGLGTTTVLVSGARDLPPADTLHGPTLNTYSCAELAVGSGVALKELTARLGQSGRD